MSPKDTESNWSSEGHNAHQVPQRTGTSIFFSLTSTWHEVLCLAEDGGKYFTEVLSWKKKEKLRVFFFLPLYDHRPKKKFVTLNVYERGKPEEQT